MSAPGASRDSRREAEAKDAAATLVAKGYEAYGIELDVTDTHSVEHAAEWVRQNFGTLDLINNAGILPEATDGEPHEFASARLFQETFATNVSGAVAMIEALLPMLRTSSAGRIVNISTTMGSLNEQLNPESPYYGMVVPAYQSSKAALNAVTIALSKKLRDTDITATSVCPGFVQTDLTPVNREQAPLTAGHAHRPP
ncbi:MULTISPECIES: SDR family NAD(P)-dependent oxidoreductase [Nocardia]|uniref:SDR family NAD(P)-dependent oxidoreductase n=1 Tax=Nocardia TaxID=1817 RepID=UPI0018938286|nr:MULTISPECIES: SDR family NAD(P)-dependent oxidoreductase [Nocardia]MBF6350955.1 SDR family NAD(P)-dependent oxidoreductase [Nocardia flavorosea]